MADGTQKHAGSADDHPDDVTVVGVGAVSQPADDASLEPTALASTSKGADDAAKSREERKEDASPEAPPSGLTDQTNFLPTRQVITVFLGLSVALACSFLDQTMCVLSTFFHGFLALTTASCHALTIVTAVLRLHCLEYLPTFTQGVTARG